MTLKIRNNLFIILFCISLACVFAAILACTMAFLSHQITPPPALRIPAFLNYIPFAPYHFLATMLSIAVLVFYVPATFFLVYRAFENTQSSEIIFFAGFLLSCLCEGARILIPLYGLGESFSQLQFFCGRILLVGRILAPLSLITAAIMSDIGQRQDIERNFMIMIAVSTMFALLIPLNTAQLTSSCTIYWGFPRLIGIIKTVLSLTAVLSFLVNGIKHDSREMKKSSLAVLVLLTGYQLLAMSDNFLFLAFGTLLLVGGTYYLLASLHTLYMWK